MNWIIDNRDMNRDGAKYKYGVGYYNNDFYVRIFQFETLKSAVNMINYLNGGTGKCNEYIMENNQ